MSKLSKNRKLYKPKKTNTRKQIASHRKTKQSMQFREVILFLFSGSSKITNTCCRQNSHLMDAKACGIYTSISHHTLEQLIVCLDFHLEKTRRLIRCETKRLLTLTKSREKHLPNVSQTWHSFQYPAGATLLAAKPVLCHWNMLSAL